MKAFCKSKRSKKELNAKKITKIICKWLSFFDPLNLLKDGTPVAKTITRDRDEEEEH